MVCWITFSFDSMRQNIETTSVVCSAGEDAKMYYHGIEEPPAEKNKTPVMIACNITVIVVQMKALKTKRSGYQRWRFVISAKKSFVLSALSFV